MAEEHVLIIDDDPTVQRLLEKVMTSNQLIPSVVGSGEAALDQVRAHTFDLILLDINIGRHRWVSFSGGDPPAQYLHTGHYRKRKK